MRLLFTSYIILIYNIIYPQKNNDSNNLIIEERISTINKRDLFDNWKNLTSDTINPTFIEADLNNNGACETIGFYEGIETGLFIFENNKNEIVEQYRLLFYDHNKWFSNGKFLAVMFLLKKGTRIKIKEKKKPLKLKKNSIRVIMSDKTGFIIVYDKGKYHKINI